MHPVKAIIDSSATRIFISPSLLKKLELPHEPAFTSTQGLNDQVMMFARKSRKASLLVEYFEHLKPVDKSEVSVVPMKPYHLVLGLPWFKARNPEIECTKGRLTALRLQNSTQRAEFRESDRTSALPELSEENTIDRPPTDIQLLGATTFGHLSASEEEVEAFAIRLGEYEGFHGTSRGGRAEREGNQRMMNAQAGASAVVAAEVCHSHSIAMTATGSPKHYGSNYTTGVAYCDEPSDPANPGPLHITTLRKHATMEPSLMRIETDLDNVEMVTTDDRGRISEQYPTFVEVFMKKMTRQPAPYRQIDHAIDQEPDYKLQSWRIYNLPEFELKTLKCHIENNLAHCGRDRSVPLAVVSIVFAKDQDDGLQMYDDYQALNLCTVLNRDPLPQI